MTVAAFLADLRGRGIDVELVEGRLVSRARKGALTPELAAAIKDRRDEILAFLREGLVERGMAAIPPIVPVPRQEFMPVSYSQERLWYLNQVDENPAVYNLPLSFRVVGAVDVARLQRCLDTIESRHEALRTTVQMVQGQAMQKIHPPRGIPIVQVDARPGHRDAGAPPADALLAREAMAPFDLASGPLARCTLIRITDEEYYFLLVTHHVISDGLSTQIILRELVELYEALGAGREPRLPALPVQFVDYAVWQRGWLQGAALDEQLAYWKQQLGGTLPVLDVASDYPRPAVRTANGAKEPLRFEKALVNALARIGRDEGATTFMVLLAVYFTLLHRHTGQDEVIIGTPVANRIRRESADIVGFIANTVVLRLSFAGAPSFREVVRRVRDVCVGAFRHQDMPFQKIVEVLQPPRDLSRTPIFQAFFTFHEISSQATHLGDLELHPVVAGSNVSRMDLSLFIRELDEQALGSLEYNTDLYARETIVRMTRHLVALGASAAAAPDLPVGALDMFTPEERAELAAWNATALDVPRSMVHELVSDAARRAPDRVAVRCGPEALTYRELDERSNALAARIQQAGAGTDALVGVCTDRSAGMVVALLAVLKAGAAYVPLDPAFPAARLAYMLQDAQVQVVVTDRASADRLPEGPRRIWIEEATGSAPAAPPSGATPDSRAYVMYTSGSTGQPKGVEVLHRNVVNFLTTMRERPGIAADDVLVAVTTLSFDIAGLELLLPLVAGATVVVAPRETAMDGARLGRLLAESGATVMQATPATWRLLLDAGWQGRSGLRALCGGEALPADLPARLLPLVGELWNMYGPTETTIWSTCARLASAAAPIGIGTPIGNTTCVVVDAAGRELPVGVPGELLIGGAGVARGYLGRPELTAERFVTRPAGNDTAPRYYRTGDLVRRRADGSLEHLGRLDDQVKVQGFRIELGEIESVLADVPAIAEAVAAVFADTAGDARLVAYVRYRPGQQLTVSEVRRHLRERLPAYMVPGLVVPLDGIPRTASGKVDRRALPHPLGSAMAERGYVAPATPTEQLVADTWGALLPVNRVGRHDNFFELGGHSLLSMRAVATIQQRTGVRLDPRLMFFQTVEQIAGHLDQRLVVRAS